MKINYQKDDKGTISIKSIAYDFSIMKKVDHIEIVYAPEGSNSDTRLEYAARGPYNILYITGVIDREKGYEWILDPNNKHLLIGTGDTDKKKAFESVYLPGKIEEPMTETSGPFGEDQIIQLANHSGDKYQIFWIHGDYGRNTKQLIRTVYLTYNGRILKHSMQLPPDLIGYLNYDWNEE